MAEHIDPKEPLEAPSEPRTLPVQPVATPPMKRGMPIIMVLGTVILIVGLANVANFANSTKRQAKSSLATKPVTAGATQVSSFERQQQLQAQKDAAEQARRAELAAQVAELQREQAVPGPESTSVPPMTAAQRAAIYGENNPNAPQRTSNMSQTQAEAKQRALAREQEHQRALGSGTVAIDFSQSTGGSAPAPVVAGERMEEQPTAQMEVLQAGHGNAPEVASGRPSDPPQVRPGQDAPGKGAMDNYDFDAYTGRLYRVFEGTVLEGVVTNHIDGALAGPMIVMLTTDYYSHDHQQLLLPQGTRLIGQVQSVGAVGQRKLIVMFDRAICPDGFSIDLNKFQGLDPLGTTGLATDVNNHYLSSFAAAAAIGGLGGLAQINNGSVLSSSAQVRNGITAQTAQEGTMILDRFLSRLPIITVKEGSRARVYINHDILIPSYAEHRVDPAL